MSGTKFFIHGGGTWREVNESDGRVTGWGKIQFVYLSRGRLVVAQRNSVLRGLRALLAGKPTTVRDGSRVQVLRPKKKEKRERKNQENESNHCKCCTCQHGLHHNHQLATDILFNKLLKPNTHSTATQCVLTPDIPKEIDQNAHTEDTEKCTETEDREHVPAKPLESRKVPRKELIIDEDDVLLVRTFIEHDKRNIFDISLVDYDADDNCKRAVFYKINPLVIVEKSSKIAKMIRPPSQCSSVSLQEFITHLGLQSIHEVTKRSKYKMRQRKSQHSFKANDVNESDTDKENIVTSSSRSNTANRQERNVTKKSLMESKNKIRKVDKTSHYEPVKLPVGKSPLRKLSGVKNNSLLNMTRRFRSDKNVKTNKNYAGNSVDDTKEKSDDDKILQKNRKSRLDTADKTSLIKSKNKNHSNKVSSDSESISDREKSNSVNISRTLRSVNRNRPTAPINNDSQAKNMSENKSTIENIKPTKNLSQSLPTRSTRNKTNELPFELSSDEDTFQQDKTSDKSKIGNEVKQSSDTNKQQKSKQKGGGDKKTSQTPNTTSKRAGRVYSRAEDEAIVSWLKVGERASLVNGNRIWKELKPIHQQTTGHYRPWQSLRNRYLRYILPALGSLAVPPALAQRLRAAAAQGEIKNKSVSKSANNSIFKSAPVRSAWALRPKSPDRSPPSRSSSPTPPRDSSKSLRTRTPTASTSKSTRQLDERESESSDDNTGTSRAPFKRTLRSSAVQSPTLPTPKAKVRRDSLTYSELTRRFASRHRSTPQSDSSDTRGEKRRHDSSDLSDDSDDNPKVRRVTRTDSKVSPSLLSGPKRRRSKRFRSKSKTPERHRTRRLYNPKAI